MSQQVLSIPVPRIGCAGWSLAAAHAARFAAEGTHLERYARVFNAVEINSSFYRPHKSQTYRKWAASVPDGFRFSVKMPKSISHRKRLRGCAVELEVFLDQVRNLDKTLGCLLLQLPPSLAFEAAIALPFMEQLGALHAGAIVCEPRHVSWFSALVSRALRERGIARVAADPARFARAAVPAGNHLLEYARLHGSPRMYYDTYSDAALLRVERHLACPARFTSERWCIFDNTALGHATANALNLTERVSASRVAGYERFPAHRPR